MNDCTYLHLSLLADILVCEFAAESTVVLLYSNIQCQTQWLDESRAREKETDQKTTLAVNNYATETIHFVQVKDQIKTDICIRTPHRKYTQQTHIW